MRRRWLDSSGIGAPSAAASALTGAGPSWPRWSITRRRSGWASSLSSATRGSAGIEELQQDGGELLRRLFGHVVARVDADTAHVVGPVAPDRHGVAVELLHVVVDGAREQQRAGDPAAGGTVGLLVRAVDPDAGPVVLDHRVHRGGVVDRLQPVRVVLGPHPLRV